MISAEELDAWAPLYNRGYNSFELDELTLQARADLDRELTTAYERSVSGGSIPFRDFRREAIKLIRARLAKERQPPTT